MACAFALSQVGCWGTLTGGRGDGYTGSDRETANVDEAKPVGGPQPEVLPTGLHRRVLTLLRELVAIPSVNPLDHDLSAAEGGREGAGELVGEKRVVDYLEQHVRRLGLEYERYDVLAFRPNLVARLPGASPRVLALVGHTDTVGVIGFEGDPLSGEYRDGWLHGRGSADAKGPLVAGLLALELLREGPQPPPVTMLLAAVCDEEYRGRGIRRLVGRAPAIERAVVLEPTGLDIVVANNGGARWRIRTHGQAVHSSRAQEGTNAIHLMADVVRVIRDVVDPWLLQRRHPLCATPPANVGFIQGGGESNVVPDLCVIEVNVRTHPGEDPKAIAAQVNELIRSALPAEVAEHVEFFEPFHTSLGFSTDPGDPLVGAFKDAAAEVGVGPRVAGRPFGSDASFLATRKIPAVVFGPGEDRAAHSSDERIELAQVVQAARLLASAVSKLPLTAR